MENVLIAKIPATPRTVSFKFTWLHFPLHLSFAMSINKTQEQSTKLQMFILRLFPPSALHTACWKLDVQNSCIYEG